MKRESTESAGGYGGDAGAYPFGAVGASVDAAYGNIIIEMTAFTLKRETARFLTAGGRIRMSGHIKGHMNGVMDEKAGGDRWGMEQSSERERRQRLSTKTVNKQTGKRCRRMQSMKMTQKTTRKDKRGRWREMRKYRNIMTLMSFALDGTLPVFGQRNVSA